MGRLPKPVMEQLGAWDHSLRLKEEHDYLKLILSIGGGAA